MQFCNIFLYTINHTHRVKRGICTVWCTRRHIDHSCYHWRWVIERKYPLPSPNTCNISEWVNELVGEWEYEWGRQTSRQTDGDREMRNTIIVNCESRGKSVWHSKLRERVEENITLHSFTVYYRTPSAWPHSRATQSVAPITSGISGKGTPSCSLPQQ